LRPLTSCARTSTSVRERGFTFGELPTKIKRRCCCHADSNPLIFAK
jgi:hypothetical protein